SPRKRRCPYSSVIQQLLPVFATLLTQRQRECLHAHHIEGKRLSEIARQFGISRQAVLDAVRHGEQHILDMAECIAKLGATPERPLPHSVQSPSFLRQELAELRERIAREGIIYSPRWIVDELDHILSRLAQAESASGTEQLHT
ncbi:MAG: sigma factor-like helix-turn-helix DNA-binding protein, partial [Candidatus Sumerlaeaceae bacterium]